MELTSADKDAMKHMPADWFYPLELPYPSVRRAEYRCERLKMAGVLESKVERTNTLGLRTLYRLKTPNVEHDRRTEALLPGVRVDGHVGPYIQGS